MKTHESETGGSPTKWYDSPAKAGTVAGGVVLGAAVLIGPLEAALGAGAAYAAYRAVTRRAKEQKGTTEPAQAPEQKDPNAA